MLRTLFRLFNVVMRLGVGTSIAPSPLVGNYVAALGCIRPGDCVIDVGANLGFFAGLLAAAVGSEGHVLAFEPNPIPLRVLRKSVRRESFSQILVLPFAVSDVTQPFMMQTDLLDFGENATLAPHLKTRERLGFLRRNVKVKAIRLDDLIHENGLQVEGKLLPAPTFLKIDAEGFDFNVLRGAEQLIQRFSPTLCIEFGFDPSYPRPTYPAWLRERGYRIFDLHSITPFESAHEDALQAPYTTDLLAVPASRLDENYLATLKGLSRFGLDRVLSKVIDRTARAKPPWLR